MPAARGHSTQPGGRAARLQAHHDPRCAWQRHRQIAGDGAILVRPDRFIAWRHPAAASDPLAVLAAALSQVLARPAGTPAASAA